MGRSRSSSEFAQSLLQRVRSLSSRAVRDRTASFWMEGVRSFVQAYDAGLTFETVIESPILLKSDLAQMLARRLAGRGVPRQRVSPEQFRDISRTQHASGIGAIVRQSWTALEATSSLAGLCWIVVEQIRSPGNFGTILRTAEAVGAVGVSLVGQHCDPFAPDVVRASMGGLFGLALVRTKTAELSHWKAARGVQCVGLSPDAGRLWTEMPVASEIALVLGEERGGLSNELRSLCDATVRLPMTGRADSLNVGVAAGVVMYELVRRQHAARSGG